MRRVLAWPGARGLGYWAAVALFWLACGGSSNQGEPKGTEPPETLAAVENRPMPVILISIDTLRSDRLPAYGYGIGETPAIDALVADSLLFRRAYSHTPLTLPSHLSVLTGLLPDAHGVRDNQGYLFDSSNLPFLPRRLQELGYRSGAAVSAYVLRSATGIGVTGFDFYEDNIETSGKMALGAVARSGIESLRAVEGWLEKVAKEPFFLFFHIFEPHAPYTPPEPFSSRFEDPYDGEIAAADQVVAKLLNRLRDLGVYEDAAIVLFSDHGEGLGDHGEKEHGVFLYREALQVPLILKLPRQMQAGTTVQTPAQLVDIYPTLLDLLGQPVEAEMPGTSLLDLVPEGAPVRRIYAETFYPRLHYGWSDLASLIEGPWHYIEGNYTAGPPGELYDLEIDRSEEMDLRGSQRRRASDLSQRLSLYDRVLESPAVVDVEARAKLAALGYLAKTVASSRGPWPDPRRQFPTLAILRRAFDLARRGEHRAAVPAFKEALKENPSMPEGWEYLGISLHRLGRTQEALAAYRRALGLTGGDPQLVLSVALLHLELGDLNQAQAGLEEAHLAGFSEPGASKRLGLALARTGRMQEAREFLQAASNHGDRAAHVALGLVLSEGGQQGKAKAVLLQALSQEPTNAEAHETLGLVYLRLRDWTRAEESSRAALRRDPERVQAWNNLGVSLYYLGHKIEALESWQRAVKLDPQEWDILYNLGTRAADLGRLELARRNLRRFLAGAPAKRYSQDLAQARALLRRLGS